MLVMSLPVPGHAQVLVVLSEGSPSYRAVADELRTQLRPDSGDATRIDTALAAGLTRIDDAALAGYRVVITVGLDAAQATVARVSVMPEPPLTLSLLIPRQSFKQLQPVEGSAGKRRLSAVFIDQPLSRQLDLLRNALPDRRRVGVLLGPSSRRISEDLRGLARTRELDLYPAEVDDVAGVPAALRSVIPNSDVLLLVPDPVATSADTVFGLLLTSYRAQVPVVGFSESLLNAGAMVSLYSTAQQQGRQGAEIVRGVLERGDGLPAPQYPKYFTVRVNASVARSLGLHPPTEATLNDALQSEPAPPPGGDPAGAPGDTR